MLNKTYGSMDGFGFRVIATGDFIDQGYLITVHSIRLSPEALNAWYTSKVKGAPAFYESREAWEAYKAEKEQLRREWEERIAKLIGYESGEDSSFCITQSVSEIFTIVIMER